MGIENLLSSLHADETEQSELEQIVMSHFGHSAAVSGRQIEYRHTDGGEPAVTLWYNAHSELQVIEPGGALRSNDVAELERKIRENLLAPAAPIIGQQVLFAHVPTNGYFRYKDVFQLSPAPADAPRPPFVLGDHPLTVEFQFLNSADPMIRVRRQMRIGHEIDLLCSAFITMIKGSLGNAARFYWVIPQNADTTNLRSQYCQELYTWPKAGGNHEGFSPQERTTPLRRVPRNDYYATRGISVGQELDLPDNFEFLLDAFFALHRNAQDQFLRSSFWFRHAQRVFTYSQSASFTALVSAIEALMGPADESDRCSACGKATGLGPTRRFVDFVEKHAPNPYVSNSERRRFYAVRSALSHGGALLQSDEAYGWAALTPDTVGEYQDMDAMWQIVRVALVNWLVLTARR